MLEEVDAALGRAAGVRPGDPVVAGRRALDVVRAAEDRVAAPPGQVELGTSSLSSSGVRMKVWAPHAWFIAARARSVRIAISVWASQTMPLVW